MKILFNHIAQGTLDNASNVLTEIGNCGISCLWYNKHPFFVVGVRMYHFQECTSGREIASHIEKLFSAAEFTGKENFACLNVKESILIPSAFFNDSRASAMLDLMYGKDKASVHADKVHLSEVHSGGVCYNAYRVHPEIVRVVGSFTSSNEIRHSTSLQIGNSVPGTVVRAIVYHHLIKLFLFINGRLQLVQQYPYKTPHDAAYLLLNACHQHNMEPAEIDVVLSGIIDRDSNLFREITRYFLNVNMEDVHENFEVVKELEGISNHYFSHLTHLAACV